MKIVKLIHFILLLIIVNACFLGATKEEEERGAENTVLKQDSLIIAEENSEEAKLLPEDIIFEKDFLYNQYTLEDTYPYRDTVRVFQWDKIRTELAKLENEQQSDSIVWAVFQNKANKNGEAPLIKNYNRNAYKRISDTLGVERYQSVPLYFLNDTITPDFYGRDGTLTTLLGEQGSFLHVRSVYNQKEWLVPKRYAKTVGPTAFNYVAVVDRTNQNIITLEKDSERWLVRSMNPATTGVHRPPYQMETPLGIFVVQEKKSKMYFLVDGTSDIAGYSPSASRFCNGGYIHGVPVNLPRTTIIEYSSSLGTTPRSHMCVRNASSHAQFVYDWALLEKSLVMIIE